MKSQKSKVECVLKVVLGTIVYFLLGVPLLAIAVGMFREDFEWKVGIPTFGFLMVFLSG